MHNDDEMVGRLLSRRELVALFGASAVAAMGHRLSGQIPAGTSPLPSCVVSPQQTEGPYFVDEKLLRSDIRVDPSNGATKPGAALALTLLVTRVESNDAKCIPVSNAQVDIWQCDAMGTYSDVKDRMFDTSGQKFLRGHQITDASGTVKFVTIYPGWYPGRAVHIHFKVRMPSAGGAREFTSQFYFDEKRPGRVFAREPYSTHAGQRTANEQDGIYRQGGSQLLLPVTERGDSYASTFTIGMKT